MQSHQLKRPSGNQAKSPRVGRGGKRGYTSGRGAKGQKARAGHRIRPAIRDLIQRLPKKRGYKNKPNTQTTLVINLAKLESFGLDLVSPKILRKEGLIKRTQKELKILGQGELNKAIKIEGIPVSKSAKEKIEKAGGSILEEPQEPKAPKANKTKKTDTK